MKRIAPSQVRIGMYIESFDGSWLAHPFWRKRFHVTDPEDLRRVRQSKVRAVVIDETRTIDAPGSGAGAPIPTCIANDRVPDAVAGRSPRPRREEAAIEQDMRALFGRHVASEPGNTPSALSERAEIGRMLAHSGRALTATFESVARGEPISVARFDGIIDSLSVAMAKSRSTMIGLSRLKLKDEYTFQHSIAVGALMLGLAHDLALEENVVHDLALAGLLHDVGKMMISDDILNKPGPLTSEEFTEMKRHPQLGFELLRMDPNVSPIVLDVALRHHERLDGGGYPGGLSGDDVSLYSRIAGICDVFDALTSARSYKAAMSAQDAITMMASWKGQFDRELLLTFMRTIGAYPVGMLVRLSSRRLGIILRPGRRAGRPRARAFHCAVRDRPLSVCDVVISDGGQGEQVISEEHPESWSIEEWPALSESLISGSVAYVT